MHTNITFQLLPAILSQHTDIQRLDGSLSSLTLKVYSTTVYRYTGKFPAVDEIHISRFSDAYMSTYRLII